MTTTSVLLCLAALLTIYSDSQAAGNVNCRKQAFHPMCRGVQVKRAHAPGTHILHNTTPRKQDEELSEPEYVPVPVEMTNEALQAMPRRSNPALWSYLAERPANILLAHRKFDPDTLEITYDYE